MDYMNWLVVMVTIVSKCSSQSFPPTPSFVTSTKSNIPSQGTLRGTPISGDVTFGRQKDMENVTIVLTTTPSLWVKCTNAVELEELGNSNIARVLTVWCQDYKKIIDCLSHDSTKTAPDNPLDFFINLTFNKVTLRTKSDFVCSKFKEIKDKVSCAESSNETLAGICAADFAGGMAHVFTLYKEKDLPLELLREVACDVVLQTSFCLRDTLSACQDDVQAVLLGYYSLFVNDSCLAKERSPKQETVATKCAREASQTLPAKQSEPEPKSLLDFLILGLKTDCETFPARFTCYKRELTNITNFRDFWLSLTFDHDNAVASQKAYCEQIDKQVIPGITSKCFNKSQPGLAACEVGFAREVEAIREEWFKNPEFDGLQLQTLACRTSVTRAACLDNAMQPCGSEVSGAMAFSEIGVLPDICRRLLTVKTSQKSGLNSLGSLENNTDSFEINETNSDNQIMSKMIEEFNKSKKYLGKYERPLADEAVVGGSYNKSAGQVLEEDYIEKSLKQTDVATPSFSNETFNEEIAGGQTQEPRHNKTNVRSMKGNPLMNCGDKAVMDLIFVDILLGVLVSGLYCFQI